jgi:hypothetical protein
VGIRTGICGKLISKTGIKEAGGFIMSTRSLINVKCNDGKVRSIYVHFDGYAHLETLQEHYNSQELAEQLISLGDLSALGESAGFPPESHSYDTPVKGYCIAYGRDRGEKNTKAAVFDDFASAAKQKAMQEFIYEWDGAWRKIDLYPSKDDEEEKD